LSSLVQHDLVDVDADAENKTPSDASFAVSSFPSVAGNGNTTLDNLDEEDEEWVLLPVHTALGSQPIYYVIYDNILYTIVMLVLPLTTLTALNVRLIRELRALRRKRIEMLGSGSRRVTTALSSTGGGSGQTQSAQDSNVTLVLVIVVLVFIVCQVPALMTQLFWNILDDRARSCGGIQYYFGCISNLLVVANSAANFPIYILFNTRFRLVLRQTFCPAAADFLFRAISSRTPGSSRSKPVTPQPAAVDTAPSAFCPAAADGAEVSAIHAKKRLDVGVSKVQTNNTAVTTVNAGSNGSGTSGRLNKKMERRDDGVAGDGEAAERPQQLQPLLASDGNGSVDTSL
jgi:hypothetical protein